MGIRLFPPCFPVMGSYWMMPTSCTTNQNQRYKVSRRLQMSFPWHWWLPNSFATAGIPTQRQCTVSSGKGFIWSERWRLIGSFIHAGSVRKSVSLPFIWEKQTMLSTLWPLTTMNSIVPLRRRTQWYLKCGGYYQLSPGSLWRSESAEDIYIHKCRNIHTGNPWHIYRTVANRIIFPPEQKQTRAGQISDPLTAGNRVVLADHVIGSLHVLYAFREIQYLRGRIPVFSRSSQNRANR